VPSFVAPDHRETPVPPRTTPAEDVATDASGTPPKPSRSRPSTKTNLETIRMSRSHRRIARVLAASGLLLVLVVPGGFKTQPPAKAAEATTTSSISLPGHINKVPGPVRSAQ
jgi:hypothetical protein